MFGYAYDASGNLLSDGLNTMAWDAESRIATVGGATYVYDADGRMVTGGSGTYVYDGDGYRVEKTASSTTTLYWPSAVAGVIDESNSGGTNFTGTHFPNLVGNVRKRSISSTHPQLNNPNTSFSTNASGVNTNALFGSITNALDPRVFQIGIHLSR
jgi:hypothetical protein